MDARPIMRTITGPWVFAEHLYRIAHCLIDRDGRLIGCNLPIGNGPIPGEIDNRARSTSRPARRSAFFVGSRAGGNTLVSFEK